MRRNSSLNKVYSAIASQADPGQAFERFCVTLLSAMGFQEIFLRRGGQQGRDIDASFGGFRWFFECKWTNEDVETASFAYKFLQLDALEKSQRPDFFVLFSNGSIKSILKDLITFKQVDRNTTYEVAIWANHTTDAVFDDIVLSEAAAVVDHLQSIGSLSKGDEQAFLLAGEQHRNKRGRFIERVTMLPLFRRRSSHLGDPLTVKFAHDTTLATVHDSDFLGLPLIIIGVPEATQHGLMTTQSWRAREELAHSYKSWGMYPSRKQPSLGMLFDEVTLSNRVHTLLTEWGAVATIDELPFCDTVILPSELFAAIKEDAVRFRNYMKRGTLITPCRLFCRIEESGMVRQRRSFEEMIGPPTPDNVTGPTQLRVRRLERDFFRRSGLDESKDDYVLSSPIVSDPIRLLSPPQDYRELGLAIADSLWSAIIRKPADIEKAAKSMHDQLIGRTSTRKYKEAWSRVFKLRASFDYIIDQDRFERPYSKFDPTDED